MSEFENIGKKNSPGKMRKLKDFSDSKSTLYRVLLVVGILLGPVIWYVVTRFDKPSLFLSTPEAVWAVTVQRIRDGYFFKDIWTSPIFSGKFHSEKTGIGKCQVKGITCGFHRSL